MSFEFNVVTYSGACLIAQATSSNPIVFIKALSSENAADSKEDLSTKTQSFYTGKEGEIYAASAQNNVARVIMSFTNSGVQNPQLIKSACVLAKLASQDDSEAVIMAALSDDDSQIYIPDNTSPLVHVGIPINITINADNTVATVGAQYASLGDLERFVSMYKAGNPTTGENQTIYGIKTFNTTIQSTATSDVIDKADGADHYSLSVNRQQMFNTRSIGIYSDILNNDYRTNLAAVEEYLFENPDNLKRYGHLNLYVTDQTYNKYAEISMDTGFVSNATYSKITEYADKINVKAYTEYTCKSNSIQIMSDVSTRVLSCKNISDPFSDPPYSEISTVYDSSNDDASIAFNVRNSNRRNYSLIYGETATDTAALYPLQDYIELGTSTNKWNKVYSNEFIGDLKGLIPLAGVGSVLPPPIGSLFIAYLTARSSMAPKDSGMTVNTTDYTIRKALLKIGTNDTVTTSPESAVGGISDGVYTLMNAINGLSNGESAIALVIRTE